MSEHSILSDIHNPEDLKRLDKSQLVQVCEALRAYIIDMVSRGGGHFASSLGVVELSVALHYVFDTPKDLLVWDVGHQAYGHKILTERREAFHTNRKYGGISGFPKRAESPYDAFGVGHSSTSISAALGMAIAAKYKGEERKTVAVIGDGAITGGMAFEALNHAGVTADTDLLIVLNDNCMSIDPNVGALKEYLTSIATSQLYNKMRNDIWELLQKLPMGKLAASAVGKLDTSLKGLVHKHSNLFESLRIRYFGPIDGHNVNKLTDILEDLKKIGGVKLLHIITTKGKGYKLAEEKQTTWHAPGLFNIETGEIDEGGDTPRPPKYQDVFGHTLLELAEKNKNIFGITPAMPSGCSLKFMLDAMPDRTFDVGICEQHAVTLSAGMATQGLRVFCNIYSTFMQRAYDQVIHDVALQKLPVVFCLDRGGLVGEDGATHHGAYDLAYMRCVPNLIICAPYDEHELRHIMYTAQLETLDRPIVIRYPRGQGAHIDWRCEMHEMEIGKGRVLHEGTLPVAVLSLGTIGRHAETLIKEYEAEKKPTPSHYDMRFLKPLDEKLLHEIFTRYPHIITIEDGTIVGGFGSAVTEFAARHNYKNEIHVMGVPDRFVEHGTIAELQKECCMDKDALHACLSKITTTATAHVMVKT